MKRCAYCGHSNLDNAIQCRKCEASLVVSTGTLYEGRQPLVGSAKAHSIRSKALSLIALGLLINVYWGGKGPWPVLDSSTLAGIRAWLEPALLYGGAGLYVVGWILHWV